MGRVQGAENAKMGKNLDLVKKELSRSMTTPVGITCGSLHKEGINYQFFGLSIGNQPVIRVERKQLLPLE